jgi:hypothetical protein
MILKSKTKLQKKDLKVKKVKLEKTKVKGLNKSRIKHFVDSTKYTKNKTPQFHF